MYECLFMYACVCARALELCHAGAEAERKLDAYRDYLYHLDQAQPVAPHARPCAVLHSTPAVRAAQASSALENFVGKVYRGIDCKVSHELYQVGGRPRAVPLQYPYGTPQYRSHELYQEGTPAHRTAAHGLRGAALCRTACGGRPCAVPGSAHYPSWTALWQRRAVPESTRVLTARRGGARRSARRSRGSSSRRRPSTSTSRAGAGRPGAVLVGYPSSTAARRAALRPCAVRCGTR